MESPRKPVKVSDQRESERQAAAGQLGFAVPAQELQGELQDASPNGIMFYADGPLQVQVEFEQGGKRVMRTGRLVRLQKADEVRSVVAVEFDRESD